MKTTTAQAQAEAATARDCGAFPLRAIAPVKERRAADSLLRDIAEAQAAAAIFS